MRHKIFLKKQKVTDGAKNRTLVFGKIVVKIGLECLS